MTGVNRGINTTHYPHSNPFGPSFFLSPKSPITRLQQLPSEHTQKRVCFSLSLEADCLLSWLKDIKMSSNANITQTGAAAAGGPAATQANGRRMPTKFTAAEIDDLNGLLDQGKIRWADHMTGNVSWIIP